MMESTVSPEDLHWGAITLELIVRSTFVLATAWVISLGLRRASAAVRHANWTLALAASLTVAVLNLSLPSWSCSILPAPSQVESTTSKVHTDQPGTGILPPLIVPPLNEPTRSVVDPSSASPPVKAPIVVRSPRKIWPWIVGLWGLGVALAVARLLVGRICLRFKLRRTRPIKQGESWSLMVELAKSLGIGRSIRLYQGDRCQMPMTWGSMRPVILLPAEFEDWSSERRRDVLLHELAHIRRFDCLTQAVAQVACAVYWFNPLAWLASAQMRIEREHACDDLVLALDGVPSDYAVSLLAMARQLRSGRAASLAALAMARPSQLEGRLLAILEPARNRGGLSRRSIVLALLMLAVALLPVSTLRFTTLAAQTSERREPAPVAAQEKATETMLVAGRVLAPDGKPVSGALVDIFGRPKVHWQGDVWRTPELEMMGHAKTEKDGQFRLTVPRTSSSRYWFVKAQASAQEFGLAAVDLDPDAEKPVVEIQLEKEQIRTIKLVDEQGRPAANLPVTLVGLVRETPVEKPVFHQGHGLDFRGFPEASSWPTPDRTDDHGRLRLTRIGEGFKIHLFIRDLRFSRQKLIIPPTIHSDSKETVYTLRPARIIEGRVLAADTGRPIPNAEIAIDALDFQGDFGSAEFGVSMISFVDRFRVDAEGRFRVNPPQSGQYDVIVFPPSGEPYPPKQEHLEWDQGKTLLVHDFKLPRGVLVRGKVIEAGRGRPLGGARIGFVPTRGEHSMFQPFPNLIPTDEAGTFQFPLLPNKGHLLVYGPTPDFVAESIGESALHGGPSTEGSRVYADRIIPYEVKAGEDPTPLIVDLKPSITVRGRAISPDRQNLATVKVLSSLIIEPNGISGSTWHADQWEIGRFEIRGVSPEVKSRVSLLDVEHEWGTSIEVGGSHRTHSLNVTLEPCGRAKIRLVGPDGKPRVGLKPSVVFVASPGAAKFRTVKTTGLLAEEFHLTSIDPKHYSDALSTDTEGRVTLPALIPGASYRLYDPTSPTGAQLGNDFTVKAGETLDLGDFVTER